MNYNREENNPDVGSTGDSGSGGGGNGAGGISSNNGLAIKKNESMHADMYSIVSKVLHNYNWSVNTVNTFTKSKTDNIRIKRPMNAFMVWAQAARKQLAVRFPQMHNSELSKNLGRLWREFGNEEKRPFIEEAQRLRDLHRIQFPDYKYQPGRRKKLNAGGGVTSATGSKTIVRNSTASGNKHTATDSRSNGFDTSTSSRTNRLSKISKTSKVIKTEKVPKPKEPLILESILNEAEFCLYGNSKADNDSCGDRNCHFDIPKLEVENEYNRIHGTQPHSDKDFSDYSDSSFFNNHYQHSSSSTSSLSPSSALTAAAVAAADAVAETGVSLDYTNETENDVLFYIDSSTRNDSFFSNDFIDSYSSTYEDFAQQQSLLPAVLSSSPSAIVWNAYDDHHFSSIAQF